MEFINRYASMKPNATFLLLGVLGLYACGGGGNASVELSEPITLQADSIAVEQILAPQQIAVRGDVALILSQKTDTVFYAYGLPDFRFLYKQGVRGQGPDDFLMGSMVSCPSRSEFAYYDIYGRTVRLFELTRKGFEKKWEYRVNMRSCEVLSVVNDSIVMLEKHDWNTKELGVYAYNGRSGKITDSLPGLKTYIKSTRIGYTLSTMLNRYSLQGYGEHFVVSYQLMDRIEFYRVSPQGKIELVAEVGNAELPESVKNYLKVDTENPPGGDRWKTPSLENIRFYYGEGGYACRDYVFILDKDGRPLEQEKAKNDNAAPEKMFRVYSWDGRLLARLRMPFYDGFYQLPFAVSESRKTIYAINPEKDFEYVYTFSYDF